MTPVLIPAATEAQWLEARRAGITASEIAVVLGLSPWGSPYKLWHQKAGLLPADGDSDAMERGRVLEPVVADKFSQRHPEFAIWGDGRKLYAHPDRRWQMATPDRTLTDNWLLSGTACRDPLADVLAVFEAKTTATWEDWGDGPDEIPVHYRCQVLWQCDVMGVTAWFLGVLNPGTWQFRVYEGTVDGQAQDDLKLMRAEASRFLRSLELGCPPAPDWRPATTDALRRLHPSVEDRDVAVKRRPVIAYRAACKAYKAAGQRKQLAENQLRELLGNGRRITDIRTGEVIATRQVYDVKEHVRKASTVDKLVPAPAPKESP